MSIENVQTFISKVQTDEPLRGEVIALGQDMDALLQLAAKRGYSFTVEDFNAVVQTSGYTTGQSISEEELVSVAGGICSCTCDNQGAAKTSWTSTGCC